MLHLARKVRGATIHATDGDIGSVEDFYIEESPWVVRYLLVDTGTWLSGRRVLLSPMSVRGAWGADGISVTLTRDQVRNSPAFDPAGFRSREHEATLLGYYGYPYYWGWSGVWGTFENPAALVTAPRDAAVGAHASAAARDAHGLQSTSASTGYHLHAVDGEIGHVDDFLIGEDSWRVRYLLVDTSNWIGGRWVVVSSDALTGVDRAQGRLHVNVTRDAVKQSPSLDSIDAFVDAGELAPPFTII